MNSTLAMWEQLWRCPEDGHSKRDLDQDLIVVAFATAMLAIVTALFYAGSYIQTENAERSLIQCRLQEGELIGVQTPGCVRRGGSARAC